MDRDPTTSVGSSRTNAVGWPCKCCQNPYRFHENIDPNMISLMIVLKRDWFDGMRYSISGGMKNADAELGQHSKFLNALAYMFCKKNYESTSSIGAIWKVIPPNLVHVIVNYLYEGFSILNAAKIGKEIYLQPYLRWDHWCDGHFVRFKTVYRRQQKE